MRMTTDTALTTTFVTGLTQVFYAASYTSAAGWNTHNLTTPFMWDGTSNLAVDVLIIIQTDFTTNAVHYNSTTAFNSCSYIYSDGVDQ